MTYIYYRIESINNFSEHAIRKHVVIREIIRTFRSENGSQNYQHIVSMLLTWRIKGKRMFLVDEKDIEKKLCDFG